jgi:hypothetical protein
MPRYATVTYDKARDFAHIRYKAAVLPDERAVAEFAAEIDPEMLALGKKVDIIVDLGELVVKAAAARAYDEARQRMFGAYAKNAYRYSGSSLVRTKILTSSTLNSQAANVFETFEQALEALLASGRRFHDPEVRELADRIDRATGERIELLGLAKAQTASTSEEK